MEMKMDKFSLKYDICLSEYENENGLKYELYLTWCSTDIWYFGYGNENG